MKKLIFLISISLFITGISKAQEELTLTQAINMALQNSNSVSSLEKNIHIQELSTSSAKGNLFPNLTLSGSWNRNNTYSEGTVRFQNGVPIIIPKQNTWINNFSLGLNSTVTLFNGLANYQQVDLEKQNEFSAKLKLDNEKYNVVYKIYTAFFDVLKKDKIVKVNDESLADSRAELEKVKEYMNVGKKTMADVYRQDVQVAQNELTLEKSKNDLQKSKVDLLLAMNADMNRDFAVSDKDIQANLSDEQLQSILAKNSNTEALVNSALEKRYDYISVRQDILIGEVQNSIDKKNLYYPTLSAFANYNLSASRINDIQGTRSFNFGLTLSYSIFQGLSLRNKSQTSEITVKQRQDDQRQLEQQMRSDIKKAYFDLETQYKQVQILNRNIVSAEQDKILSEENYKVGLGTLLDAQTAATKLNSLKVDLINAYYDFLLAERRIRYYSGDLSY